MKKLLYCSAFLLSLGGGFALRQPTTATATAQTQSNPPTQTPNKTTDQKANDKKANDKASEEQDTTLRLTTELIEVRAVVTDKAGKVVRGLQQEDFELLESNKPQEISFFSLTDLNNASPTTSPTANPTTEAAPSEKLARNATTKPARSVVLLADNTNMSPGNLLYLKGALRKFVAQQLNEQDVAAVVTTFGTLGVGEQFTRDRRLLRFAIERLNVAPSERASQFSPYLAGLVQRGDRFAMDEAIRIIQQEDRMQGLNRQAMEQMAQNRASEVLNMAAFRSRNTQLTLRSVVDRLAQMPGQRLLVLFSDGFTLLDNTGRFDSDQLQNITSRATRSGVVIYSIDSKGLQTPPGMSAEFSAPVNMQYASAAENELEDGLNALAVDTGGKFFRNTNDLAGAAKEALADNETFYTLAYYPAEEGSPNKFRKLTVRVKGHPEYRVRTQKGYLPSALAKTKTTVAKTLDQRVAQAMAEPLATTELGVVATAEDLEEATDPAQVTLKVFINGQDISFQPAADNRQQMSVKIVYTVFDSAGKLALSEAQTINGNLQPPRYENIRKNGMTYLKRLVLKPGFYQIRVGATDLRTERLGTASAVVQVPDLKSKKLALSNLFVADMVDEPAPPSATGAAPGSGPVPTTGKATPPFNSKVVQGIRFFQPKQPFLYYFRIYQNAAQAAKAEELELQSEIWSAEKVIAKGEWVPAAERTLGRDAKGLTIGGQLHLTNFAPGLYELRLNVRVKQKKAITQRTLIFGIEP